MAAGWSTVVDGPVYTIAPYERLSSALQSALMFREAPRIAADGCETGDWLHVDLYLTKHPGTGRCCSPARATTPR